MVDQSDDELLQIDNLIDTCSFKMTTPNDFQRFRNAISSNINKISTNTSDLEWLAKKIDTPEDSESLRERYRRLQDETKSLAQQTNKDLEQLRKSSTESTAEQRQRKVIIEQLTKQYLAILKSFQGVQRIGLEKEKNSLGRARAVSYQQQSTDESRSADSLQPSNTQLQQQVANIDDLKARGEQLRKLETDIVAMNDLFKDVDNLVHGHTVIIDLIERHVEASVAQVKLGNRQLVQALKKQSIAKAVDSTEENVVYATRQLTDAVTYQSSGRRKKFIIIAVVIVLLLILGIGLYFGLRK